MATLKERIEAQDPGTFLSIGAVFGYLFQGPKEDAIPVLTKKRGSSFLDRWVIDEYEKTAIDPGIAIIVEGPERGLCFDGELLALEFQSKGRVWDKAKWIEKHKNDYIVKQVKYFDESIMVLYSEKEAE